jgi:hypothetical protein
MRFFAILGHCIAVNCLSAESRDAPPQSPLSLASWNRPVPTPKVMEGMATNIRPSRPEITDVVNSVYDGADGIVLMQVGLGAQE